MGSIDSSLSFIKKGCSTLHAIHHVAHTLINAGNSEMSLLASILVVSVKEVRENSGKDSSMSTVSS
jgi:hypothetical protein